MAQPIKEAVPFRSADNQIVPTHLFHPEPFRGDVGILPETEGQAALESGDQRPSGLVLHSPGEDIRRTDRKAVRPVLKDETDMPARPSAASRKGEAEHARKHPLAIHRDDALNSKILL